MLRNFVEITRSQYEAGLSTLNRCLKVCSEEQWRRPVANLSFSQSAFHALFYVDVYLHPANDETFQSQEFHLANKDSFQDYEELQDRPQVNHYERSFVQSYLLHCLEKMRAELGSATEEWLLEPSPFPWIESTRSEVHLYNIRHLQHHAAQLILILRHDGLDNFPWFKMGWKDS